MKTLHVGGLTDVGFGERSEQLLVLSHDGRGLFDCRSGVRLARDDEYPFAFDEEAHLADGIGALDGVKVRTAGLFGGGVGP